MTGSSGHLGEALMLTLKKDQPDDDLRGLDICPSEYTTHVGSITDPVAVREAMDGVQVVYHTATLQKPHIATHSRQDFVDTNITGTLTLLEEAVKQKVESFVFTSSTSVFGDALKPVSRNDPAVWITEDVVPISKNIYGVTKIAAENLCQIAHRNQGLNCIILRTSRFFPEEDDESPLPDSGIEPEFCGENLKANEYLHRRCEIGDIVAAHRLAAKFAPELGFDKFIISATTPFSINDVQELQADGPGVVAKFFPDMPDIYSKLQWKMYPSFDRVYSNAKARSILGWTPKYDFRHVLDLVSRGQNIESPLAAKIGIKGYNKNQTNSHIKN